MLSLHASSFFLMLIFNDFEVKIDNLQIQIMNEYTSVVASMEQR